MQTFVFGFFLVFYMILTPILLFPYLLIFPFSRVKAKTYVAHLLAFTIRFVFKLIGIHLVVKGRENFPLDPKKPVMIVANHQSSWDIVILLAMAIRPIGFISKKEVAWFFPINLWMLALDCVFLDRKSPKKALSTMNKVAKNLLKGDMMCIFPEGTRSKGKGDMIPFKRGGFKTICKTEAALLPVTIEGSYKSWEDKNRVESAVIYLTFHPLIETKALSQEEKEDLPEETWGIIHEELKEIKSLPEIPISLRKKEAFFMSKEKKAYDESAIQTLSSLEHIRRRSGMYIGRLGDGSSIDDGIYVLLKEIIDNSIDEFIMGYGKKVNVFLEGKKVVIRDFGRGIPLGKVVECVSTINTGAKYNDDVFQFSVGLNGVGTKAVNALSSHFLVRSHREGKYFEALFSRGVLLETKEGDTKEKQGTYVEFIPDEEIFGSYHFELDFIEERFFQNVALNHGLEIIFNNKIFIAPRGLLDLLYKKLGENEPLYDIIHYQGKKLEFAFLHLNTGGESYYSFVNGQFTSDGGTHQSAFREGILKGINEFFGKSYSGSDVREGLVGILSVKVKEPMFESQTKNKLGNTEIRSEIVNETKSAVSDFLHKNTSLAKRLEEKIISNEKLRKELFAVEKEAREKIKKITLKIPQLRDCKIHLGDAKGGEETMVFLTEGQSATGSMISSRDVYRQAIFSLRGKPQNLVGNSKAEIYKNEELFNLMMALGIENSLDNLRYEKIVIATDADYDGFHIRNLLLTFFLHYFRSLVINGHIYILETPLFRVRNSSQTIYCYSEYERDKAISHLKGKTETTRFKGLGEISPKEFGQFIHPETMKLISVSVPEMMTIEPTLDFYMGKNTPKRRDFIMENLI